MDLDLSCVASFLMLVQEQHFGRSAERLHVTASALTKRIQRLERQIGVPLVDREIPGVFALTPAGFRFADAAGPLLEHARAVRAVARQGLPQRVIRLGLPAGVTAYMDRAEVAELARQLRLIHPEIGLRGQSIPFRELPTCLVDETVDVLLTVSPLQHPAVVSEQLAEAGRTVVLSTRHALADAPTIDVATLVDEPIIVSPSVPDEWMNQWYLGDIRPAREARLDYAESQDAHTVMGHIRQKEGLAVLMRRFAPVLGPDLRAVEITGASPTYFCAARRRRDHRTPVLDLVTLLGLLTTDRVSVA